MEPNIPETHVGKKARERARGEPVAVGEAEQVVMRHHDSRGGREGTAQGAARGCVRVAVGHAKRERSAGVEQLPRAPRRGARVGKLLERVPDGHGVEPASRDVVQLADCDAKAHSAREGRGVLVHVEPLEGPSGIARGGEEGADVASHLEACTAASVLSLEPPDLRSIGMPLILMQSPERCLVRLLALVRLDELHCALAWIAIDERALAAAGEPKRRTLRERNAVRECAWWRVGP